MKKIIFLSIVALVAGQAAMSQDASHVQGGNFRKTIEYNALFRGIEEGEIGLYNLRSKSLLERMLFGKTNSMVEYVFDPLFDGPHIALGLRIVKNPDDDTHLIEVMRLPDSQKVLSLISRNTATITIPDKFQANGTVSLATMQLFNEFNKSQDKFPIEEYIPEPKTFAISDGFAERLYNATVWLIDNFRAEGIPSEISGGYTATFRSVVGDELWALRIHIPQKLALQLSDLFVRIIEDVTDGKADEAEYMKILDDLGL